jgi:hypothetical protein
MKLKIPDDWDGSTWSRFCICWPDSQDWRALLLGFLTFTRRGRAWDENTGSILAAQAIGQEIYQNNYPFEEVVVTCSDAQWIAKAILFHAAVTGGFAIDPFPVEITDATFNVVDFRVLGLANRLGPEVNQGSANTIQATLAALKVSIDALTAALGEGGGGLPEDLEDDLAKVWGALDDITTILGGDPSVPPDPL